MKTKLFLLQILCLSISLANGQTNLTNTGILKLSSSGDILYVTAKFANSSTASFTNNGQLYVLGNVDNNQASMTAGTGTLYLNGNNTQTLSGTEAFKTYNFISNNSAGIVLDNDLSVTGAHTFSNGVITTSSTPNYLIYEAGSSYSGSGDARHVNGWVKKIGSTDFIFPVGNGIYQRPVALENLSDASEFDVKYKPSTPNNNQLQLPLKALDPYEYWEINQISGGRASVHMNWDNTKVTFPCYVLGDIAASYFDGSYWTDQGGTGTGDPTMAGDVTSNAVSSFGYYAIGSRSFPLPLNFLSFTTQRKENYTNLKWVTSEEVNTDHFEIERSENGIHFIELASMPTLNRFNVQEYTYKDFFDFIGVAYYRIRCVDRDGKSKFSKIMPVYESSWLQKSIVVLNPASDEIIILSRTDDKEPSVYILFNEAGSTISKGRIQLMGGMANTIRLSFKPAKGIYILKLYNSGREFIQKLVIN
ncbi:MAG TPA: T9SS type A sorting domain-containing protein [Chitinophagaceae bacterium]|nr:T9SS type A sorting domain-containing protein [Chitinophagaceae bacterium]